MREQSYKERKKKLMTNIKKDEAEKKKQSLKLMDESFHSTNSQNEKSKYILVNEVVISKLDKINEEASKKFLKEPNPMKGNKDNSNYQYTPSQPSGFKSQISTYDKNYLSDIPSLLHYPPSSSDTGGGTFGQTTL